MNRHERYINQAVEIATETDMVGGAKVACIMTYKNNPVCIGLGQYKTDPFHAKFSQHPEKLYIHAETMAIKNFLKVLGTNEIENATMYVARVWKDGTWGMAKPCRFGCQQAIEAFNIKRVVYTTGKDSEFEIHERG